MSANSRNRAKELRSHPTRKAGEDIYSPPTPMHPTPAPSPSHERCIPRKSAAGGGRTRKCVNIFIVRHGETEANTRNIIQGF